MKELQKEHLEEDVAVNIVAMFCILARTLIGDRRLPRLFSTSEEMLHSSSPPWPHLIGR